MATNTSVMYFVEETGPYKSRMEGYFAKIKCLRLRWGSSMSSFAMMVSFKGTVRFQSPRYKGARISLSVLFIVVAVIVAVEVAVVVVVSVEDFLAEERVRDITMTC